jgi:hypothetical protein
MADGVTFQTTVATPASGTVVATDDVGGAHYQVVKIALGLNSAVDVYLDSGQQTMANSAPVTLASDQSDVKITLDGESVAISGTVQVQSNSANLATQATVAAIQTAVEIIDNAISGSEMQTDIVSITAGASVDIGAIADVEATGNGSIIAILKRLRTLLGGTLTVSGTVAATQSGTWNVTNISGTVSLPTGASTSANQSTIIGHLDGVEGLLTTIDADTSSLAGAVSGTEMQVDIVAALPAGTNNIGDVDILSAIPGTGATNLGKAEDAAHTTGDTGVLSLSVRRDANTSLVDTDGDYAPLQVDSTGSLKVAIISGAGSGGTAMADDAAFSPGTTSITPVGGTYRSARDTVNDNDAGAFAMTASRAILAALETPNGDTAMDDTNDAVRVNVVAGSGSGVSHTDDAAFTAGTDDVVPIAGFFDDDTPDSVNEGDAGAVRMSANRNLYVNIRDAAGNERGLNVDASGNIGVTDAGGALTVDNGGTFAVQVSSIAAGDNNIGNVDLASAIPAGTNNIGDVDIASIAAGDNNIGNVDVVTLPNVTIGTNANLTESLVDDAAFTPGTSRVLPVGFEFDDDTPDSVNEGDIGAARMSANRNIYVTLRDAAGNERGLNVDASGNIGVTDAGGELTVNGTVTANLAAGTNNIGDVDILTIAAGDNNIGNVDIVTMPNVTLAAGTNTNEVVGDVAQDAAVAGNPLLVGGRASAAAPSDMSADGDAVYIWTTLKGAVNVADAGGSLTVDGTVAATQSGTWTLGANSGVDIGDVTINNASGGSAVNIQDGGNTITVDGTVTAANTAGDIAHDTADSGNPVKVGGKAYNFDGTEPGTAVAEGDRANVITDVYGRVFVETTHPRYWTVSADYASAQTNTSVKATPGASLKLYITDVIISNGATAGNITLLNGSGGTVLLELYPAINGGAAMPFRTPIVLSADTALCITSTTVTTHSVTICGYIAP